MTEINAKYAPTRRKVADLIEARKEKIQSLIESFKAYENLFQMAKKAVEFYETLNSNIQDLIKKVEKTMAQNENEKDAIIAKLATPKGKQQSGFQNDKIKLTHDFLLDFSLKWPDKVEFSISVIIENCAWGKSGKNAKYKIYLMKCIQKG